MFDSGDIALMHDLRQGRHAHRPAFGARSSWACATASRRRPRRCFTRAGCCRRMRNSPPSASARGFPGVALSYLAGGHVRVGLEDGVSQPRRARRIERADGREGAPTSSRISAARSQRRARRVRCLGLHRKPPARARRPERMNIAAAGKHEGKRRRARPALAMRRQPTPVPSIRSLRQCAWCARVTKTPSSRSRPPALIRPT